MTTSTGPALTRQDCILIHRTARQDGLAPALALLGEALPAGGTGYGPHGHAVVPADRLTAEQRDPGGDRPKLLGEVELPGGAVALLHHPGHDDRAFAGSDRGPDPEQAGRAFRYGLAWLRLGISEGLRDAALRYLADRRVGDTPLIQQQLVKAAVAESLTEQLEVRATLDELDATSLPGALLHDLHRQLTHCDRAQVQLLGAGGYLSDGPGQVAYLSELLAEAYVAPPPCEPAASPARSRSW
ncbi:hypothetical protein GCM10018790_68170 [Kitasatospora xanthocidica]|uniref:DUF2786 domain-containing protein n=1 Tax=Kitasatospora xanthocidica TaxID=83382 RepID=UPI001677E6B5|nr:DUF2786 domain-containing protein [Kitasatospora xanthocidica]GHF80792.1 hypothetical protein GCM10018790_68170 [Kitasatospora xanthocidica]